MFSILIWTSERHTIKSFISCIFGGGSSFWRAHCHQVVALPEPGDIRGQISSLEDTSYYIRDDFNYVSRIIDELKFTIRDFQRTLKGLKKDFARQEAELAALGDAQVDFEYHLKRFTNISRSVEQVIVLEVALECLRKTIEE